MSNRDTTGPSRRQFLETAGLAALGTTLGAPKDANAQVRDDAASPAQASEFAVAFEDGAITSLRYADDAVDTEYVTPGARLGDLIVRYRQGSGEWLPFETGEPEANRSTTASADGTEQRVSVAGPPGSAAPELNVRFTVAERSIVWSIRVRNPTDLPLEIGDLAIPLPINRNRPTRGEENPSPPVLKHSLVAGHGSYLAWTRANSVGPYLMITPDGHTRLEYWESEGGYRVFIHSAAAGAVAAGRGCDWRQPNTSLALAPGSEQSYSFTLRWADDYDHAREVLVEQGLVDVHVVPGMTVPTDLPARFALRFARADPRGGRGIPRSNRSPPHGYKRRRRDLRGELLQAWREPPHGPVRRRPAHAPRVLRHRAAGDPHRQARGLHRRPPAPRSLALVRRAPRRVGHGHARHARARQLRPYRRLADLRGHLRRPRAEQTGLPCLQECGIPRPGRGRGPRLLHRELRLGRTAADHRRDLLLRHLRYPRLEDQPGERRPRAYGQAAPVADLRLPPHHAHVPEHVPGGEGPPLHADGTDRATIFDARVRDRAGPVHHPLGVADPEGPEEAREVRVGWVDYPASTRIPLEAAQAFMETQMAANVFCRGWLENAYYLLGSDIRGSGGNSYTLSYMSQMGGWSVLDYALHHAEDPWPYLRLGYASFLSAWALMNTGTPESDYGYWYPGPENDGGAGGGFEPAPYGETWLDQPHSRGSWYYSCEIDLGFCGGLRCARTVIADDPVFGRFCFGGDWRDAEGGLEVVPRDGVRRRFHAMLARARLHLETDVDRFAAGEPIFLREDLSALRFELESRNPAAHLGTVRVAGLPAGTYSVLRGDEAITSFDVADGVTAMFEAPVNGTAGSGVVTVTRVG